MKMIKLYFPEALVRQAVRAFWFRSTGWTFFAALFVTLLSFAYLLFMGDRSWFVGVVGSILAAGSLCTVVLYFSHYQASMKRFRRMRNPEATFEFDDQGFRIISDRGSSKSDWSDISKVWCFPDFWLLFFSPALFITLPLANFSGEDREFILTQVRARRITVT